MLILAIISRDLRSETYYALMLNILEILAEGLRIGTVKLLLFFSVCEVLALLRWIGCKVWRDPGRTAQVVGKMRDLGLHCWNNLNAG
jgi:hypothetical protein